MKSLWILPVYLSSQLEQSFEKIQKTDDFQKKTNFFIQYLLDQRTGILHFFQTLLIAFLVFVIGKKCIKLLVNITKRWMERRNVELSVLRFTVSVLNVVYYILLIMIVAGIVGIGTSSIIAMVGSMGLAVGLALQGSLSNFAGGVLILLLKPFQVGDYIISSGVEGEVDRIDIFYTRLITTDRRVVVVPNGTISNSNITNVSKEPKRLLMLPFMIGYQSDYEPIKQSVINRLKQEALILQSEPIDVVIDSLEPNGMKLIAKVWVSSENYWTARECCLSVLQDQMKKAGAPYSISPLFGTDERGKDGEK